MVASVWSFLVSWVTRPLPPASGLAASLSAAVHTPGSVFCFLWLICCAHRRQLWPRVAGERVFPLGVEPQGCAARPVRRPWGTRTEGGGLVAPGQGEPLLMPSSQAPHICSAPAGPTWPCCTLLGAHLRAVPSGCWERMGRLQEPERASNGTRSRRRELPSHTVTSEECGGLSFGHCCSPRPTVSPSKERSRLRVESLCHSREETTAGHLPRAGRAAHPRRRQASWPRCGPPSCDTPPGAPPHRDLPRRAWCPRPPSPRTAPWVCLSPGHGHFPAGPACPPPQAG